MKTYHCLLILINVIHLTNCEETWTHQGVGKSISNQHIKELEKIAKVTQNTDTNGTRVGTNQTRIAKSYVRLNSRMGRNEDIQSDKAKDESEVNNFVSDEEEKTNRNNTQTVKDKEASTYNFYPSRRDATGTGKRKQAAKISLPPKPALPETTPKPTKYHYYPHNQHIYLLPECAIQQVCNAVYVRLNYTQPLCACPSRKEPCSASLNTDDLHTTELVTAQSGKVLTLVKTCEPVAEMRVCRAPRDWSLLALQNIRTGKSHYLVICRCPPKGRLEGPMSHDQPAYASVPGIRVYGMMCIRDSYRISRPYRYRRSLKEVRPPLPWDKIRELQSSVQW